MGYQHLVRGASVALLSMAAMAGKADPPNFTYMWHLHQPIYWPGQKSGSPDRYEYAWDTVQALNGGRTFPIDAVGTYFDVDDREAAYQYRPWDAIQNAGFGGSGADAGAQVSYSGSLMENVNSLAGNWATYGSGWRNTWINGRRTLTNQYSKPRLDMVNFSYHHALLPLQTPRTVELELKMHRRKVELEFGTDRPLSNGLFPTEMSYSSWLIPYLKDAGIEWSIVSGNHLSRACYDFPLVLGSGGENCQPPNRADVRNTTQTNYFRRSIDRGCAPANAYPFAYTPHLNYWVNPDTGAIQTITVVPAAQEFGWIDGYQRTTPDAFNPIAGGNNPSKPMLITLAHDGDNAYGGGFSYYMEQVRDSIQQAGSLGYRANTVQGYLAQYGSQINDLVHVEDGGWVNADGDFGSPVFINWNYPILNASGQIDPVNGWHEKPREYAVYIAAENRIRTAEKIAGGPATTNLDDIIDPGRGSTSAIERAWHYYLGALDSGFLYYGDYGDVEIRGSVGCNKATALADSVLGSGFTDTVEPTIWYPQRWPYNPGSENFGVETQYKKVTLGPDFTVWTFAYDAGSTVTCTLKWRTDNDGVINVGDVENDTYAGGADVGSWNNITMNRRAFPAGNIYNKPTLNYSTLPTYIADHFSAQITGQAGKMIDYYIEAVDASGNVAKSPIKHVYVGTGTSTGGGGGANSRASISPDPAVANQQVAVTYNPVGGPIESAPSVYLHYGYNLWQTVVSPDVLMTKDTVANVWRTTVTVSSSATKLDMVFNNGANVWDSNGGADWHFDVTGGTAPPPVDWTVDGNAEDPSKIKTQTTGGLTLYAAVKGTKLYVGTNAATNDRDTFIYIARTPGALKAANWAKAGQIATWDAFLADEGTNAFSGWFNAAGTQTPPVPGTNQASNVVLEGEVDLAQLYSGQSLPSTIYIAAASFGGSDAGTLFAATQCPVTINSDGNLDAGEFYPFDTGLGLTGPRIQIQGTGGLEIVSGDATPSAADGTDFGGALVDGETIDRTFTIRNTGVDDLVLTAPAISLSGANAADFSITSAPSTLVTSGSTTAFTVRFDPSVRALRQALISIANSDSVRNPTTFTIQGNGQIAATAALEYGATSIANGDATPSDAEGTDFGARLTGTSLGRTFTIRNTGDRDLVLAGSPAVQITGASASEFSISSQPASGTIAAGATQTFTVAYAPTTVGSHTARVRIPLPAPGPSNYTFDVAGTASGTPNVQVESVGGTVIANGDSTPSSGDGTLVGNSLVGQLISTTFVVRNTGTDTLTFTGAAADVTGTNAADFAAGLSASSLPPGTSRTLTLNFTPGARGTRSATVRVLTNDPDSPTYTFAVQGGGLIPGVLTLSGNSINIASGDSTPSTTDGTDFTNSLIGVGKSASFTVTNAGDTDVTFGGTPTSITGTNPGDFSAVFTPTGALAAGASRTLSVTFTPSARGARSATVNLASSVAGSPFTFAVQGNGQLAGTLVIEGNGVAIAPGDTTPSSADGTLLGSVAVGAPLLRTFTLRNTGDTDVTLPAPQFVGAQAADFTLASGPSSTIAAGGSTSLQVRFTPSAAGNRSTTLLFSGVTPGPNPYGFTIQGTGTVSPNIGVYGAGFAIPSGDSTPGVDDLTDFGSVVVSTSDDQAPARTFQIKNDGTGALTISNVSVFGAEFSVVSPSSFPVVVQPGVAATVLIHVVPQSLGVISSTVTIASDDPDTASYTYTVRATGVSAQVSNPEKVDELTTTVAWQELGIPDAALPVLGNPVGLGSRGYDAVNTALLMTLTTNTQTRVIGWREDAATDIPYFSIGTDKVARASFSIYSVAAPGINALPSTSTVFSLPNFRIRLMQRFVINSMLEVNHNSGNTDPAVRNLAREFSPSNDPAAPSVYTVDLDPVDIPYLLGSAGVTEGVQRGVEAVGEVSPLLPDYQYVQGTLALTDSSVGTYPIPNRAQTPVKVYATGTTDFTNSDVTLTKLQLDHDPLASGIVSGLSLETSLTLTKSTAGVTVDSTLVPASKVAIAAVDFLGGNGYDQTHPESRLRIDPERLYKISFRISSTGLTTSAPQIRLRARTAKFQWTHKLELGGAAAVGSAAGRAIIAEAMPGTNSQNLDSDGSGQWYHVWFTSPLQPNVRADVAGTMLDKFPLLMAQPGNGDPTNQSVRDLKLGFDVIDTLSFGVGYEGEVAKDINLNRIEIRDYPQPDMTVAP